MAPLIVRRESVIAYSAAAGKRLRPIDQPRPLPGFAASGTGVIRNEALSLRIEVVLFT
jgi:hypothetical protein